MKNFEEHIELPPTPPPPRISNYFRNVSVQDSLFSEQKLSETSLSKLDETQINFNNFKKICTKNFSTLGSELESIENLLKTYELLMLNIEVEDMMQNFNDNQVIQIIKNFAIKIGKNFLIIVENLSKNYIFWKLQSGKIFILKLPQKHRKILNFLLDFLATSLIFDGHSGISMDALNMLNSIDEIVELELLSMANFRNYNLLMVASDVGDINAVKFLVCEGFDVNATVDNKMAVDLAWGNGHYEVVLELLKANSMYPRNYNFKEATNELREFALISRQLHNHIKSGKQHKIIEILIQNSNLRYFYTTTNVSAPVRAVLCGNFEIYELLVSRNIFIGPKENISTVLKQLDDNTRENLRGINLKYLKSLTENHLLILMGNSFVGCDVPDIDSKLEHVKMAFEFLDKLHESISLILKVVASSRDFKIIFDFHRDCIQRLDPTSNSQTKGVYHSSRHIYIAAKQLFDPTRKLEAYGTLIHELCHFAMQLVYKNDCRPYKDNEFKRFKKISDICAKKNGLEELIDLVYENYNKSHQHAELIVRVPHMMVEYAENTAKLVKCHQNFPELFNHFEGITKIAMKNSLHNIEIETDQIIKSFQYRVNRKKRQIFWMWIFSGILALLVPFALWFGVWKYSSVIAVNYSCQNLTEENVPKIFNSTVNFQGMYVIFGDLFGDTCDMISTEVVTSMISMHNFQRELVWNSYRDFQLDSSKGDKFDVILSILNGKINSDSEKIIKKYQNLTFRTPFLNIGNKIDPPKANFVERRFNLTDQNHSNKIHLLSDGAGSGKTTNFRNIAWKLKLNYPLYWISFINLKLFDQMFMHSLNLPTDFDFICEKIFNLTSEIDKAAFKWKFKNNQSILLWDEIDKLEESQLNEVLKIIDYIAKTTDNQQWISIRSSREHLVSAKLHVSVYKLDSYEKEEREEFVRKFMLTTNFTILNITIVVNEIENFVNSLGQSNVTDKMLINSPQTLNMICSLYVRNAQLPNSSNLYDFFDFYVNDLYRYTTGQNQIDFIGKSLKNFKKIHQYFALREILPSHQIEMMDIAAYESIWDNQEITAFGIIVEVPKGTLTFADRTFAEFFVAQYFNENFWWILKANKDNNNFKIVESFMNGFMKE